MPQHLTRAEMAARVCLTFLVLQVLMYFLLKNLTFYQLFFIQKFIVFYVIY